MEIKEYDNRMKEYLEIDYNNLSATTKALERQIACGSDLTYQASDSFYIYFQCTLENSISTLSCKVGDVGPILDTMAVLLEKLPISAAMARPIIYALYRTAQVIKKKRVNNALSRPAIDKESKGFAGNPRIPPFDHMHHEGFWSWLQLLDVALVGLPDERRGVMKLKFDSLMKESDHLIVQRRGGAQRRGGVRQQSDHLIVNRGCAIQMDSFNVLLN
ncbi:hypothetical protein L2E82_49037 [Cichorium intybus]|uniref:Uncharacterized protein n=1 Tax=Cichorium intybus TaxID=13427 RepID=A0ACB8Z051_CICIN|nr:hypothetical protein L2E82_49037 [Cichorium intybus]